MKCWILVSALHAWHAVSSKHISIAEYQPFHQSFNMNRSRDAWGLTKIVTTAPLQLQILDIVRRGSSSSSSSKRY